MASPESIRVRAVAGIIAPVPGYAANHGGQVEYVGRRTDNDAIRSTAKKRIDGVIVHGDPEVCYPIDPEHNAVFSRDLGISTLGTVRKMILDGDIEAADDITAKWAGVKLAVPSPPDSPARMSRRSPTPETKSEPQ